MTEDQRQAALEASGDKKKVRIEKLLLNSSWGLSHTDQFTAIE